MTNYADMKAKELKAAAKELGLEGYSKLNKEQLIAALEQHVGAVNDDATGPNGGLRIEKDRPTQNGVTRPSIGGACRAVWDALDAFRAEEGYVPTAKDVKALAADEGWNPNNASIEYYQWRKFNGITGRVKAPAQAEGEA